MKLTVKQVKGGDCATYSCSKCGKEHYKVFLPVGEQVGPIDWRELIPERCDCGEDLLIRIDVPTVVPRVIETEHIGET